MRPADAFNPAPPYPGVTWLLNGSPQAPDSGLLAEAGPHHCGWQLVTFLWLRATPPGFSPTGYPRQYVRDPTGSLSSALQRLLRLDTQLPADARATGYSYRGIRLMLAPSDEDHYAYLQGGGIVEAWPRATQPELCS